MDWTRLERTELRMDMDTWGVSLGTGRVAGPEREVNVGWEDDDEL